MGIAMTASAQTSTDVLSDYDQNAPFGFCTVSSRTNASSTYNITGGGCYTYPVTGVSESKVTTLTSTGTDMRSAIINAINSYDVIVLDGSKGDFIVSKSIDIEGKTGKTLLGINGARLCTQWYLTSDLIAALDAAGVKNKSTSSGSNTHGNLPNGASVSEEAEYFARKTLIEVTGDNNENYRKAGIFTISKNSENIIIRNITFQGPGAVDVGGYDLVSITGSKHIWIDHCVFKDGIDGNLDITGSADFNTISWCTFSYTNRSYMHQNTNLIGSSDSEPTGYLNTTYAFNWWSKGCVQRMPMARIGKVHMLNNYYTCTTASNCINPRKNSEVLIDGNYFDTGVTHYYSQSDATAVTWTTNNYIAASSSLPSNVGSTVTVPYSNFTVAPYSAVPTDVRQYAGTTLFQEYNQEPTGLSGTIAWPFGEGNAEHSATIASAVTEGIASTSVTLGSELEYIGKLTVDGLTETRIKQNNVNATTATDANAVTFQISIKNGYKFKASEVSVSATRKGTDRGKMDINWIDDGGTINIVQGVTPNRDNNATKKYSEYTVDIEDETTESTNPCKLVVNIYELSFDNGTPSYKDIGLANIIVEGTLMAPTGISTPISFSLPLSIEYYNIAGQRIGSNVRGIVIEKQRMQDGTVKARKVMK